MVWLIFVRNVESNRLEIVTPTSDFDPEDPHYDREVNIVPFEEEPDPQRLDFGVHDLHELCACHPKITYSAFEQKVISHTAAAN